MSILKLSTISHTYYTRSEEKGRLFRPKTKQAHTVLKNINLELNQGDCISLIGMNGAGKSTLMKIMMGLLHPTHGDATLFNQNAFETRRQNASKMGVIFGQKTQLWWDLSLYDAFELLGRIYRLSDYQEWLTYLMETLDVTAFCHRPVRELSFGQRMRGEFIACFLHKPNIVFLDEPTVGLDVVSKRIIIDFLRTVNQTFQTTIILTSHELEDVEKICETMYLLDEGEIVFEGTIEDFKASKRISKLLVPTQYFDDALNTLALKTYQNATECELLFSEDQFDALMAQLQRLEIRTYSIQSATLSDILILQKEHKIV